VPDYIKNREGYYHKGNSIKLKCKFRDYNNELVNPTSVYLTIYDLNGRILEENNVTNNKGGYEYFFVFTPDDETIYVYEWRGVISGVVSLRRKKLEVRFV
jgi:hypothetical protein